MITYINNKLEELNPWTKIYGLTRSIIAAAEIATLLSNHMYYFFCSETSVINAQNGFSIFRLTGLSSHGLLVAKVLMISILLFVISGYFPQISAILHVWVAYSDFTVMLPSDGGSEVAIVILTLLLPIALTDPRINHWKDLTAINKTRKIRQSLAQAFYILIRLQIAIIYFDAVVQKLPIKQWLNGTAIYYYFNDEQFGLPIFMRGVVRWLITSNLVFIPTYFALLTETVLFLFLLVPSKFWIYVLTPGILMHVTFALFIGIPSFSLIMIGALVIYLVPLDFDFRQFLPKTLKRRQLL